jgi:hypothetical protein
VENYWRLHLTDMRSIKLCILTTYIFLALLSPPILLIFYPDPNWAIITYLRKKCETCEIAESLAQADFEKRSYRLVSWGFGSKTKEMLGLILKEDYNITMLWGGCDGSYEVDCYHNKMATLLLQKYGSDFYDKARAKTTLQKQYYPLIQD